MRENLLKRKVLSYLAKQGYETLDYFGSFDVATKGEEKFIIKTLFNIDALKEWQANNIKVLSYFLNAKPLIVAKKDNRKELSDKSVYHRHEVAVLHFNLFKKMIRRNELLSYSVRGAHVVQLDCEKMKKVRQEKKISLAKLSYKTGISKKCLYEIESGKIRPKIQTARKIEKALNTKLVKTLTKEEVMKPKFERIMPKSKEELELYKILEKLGYEVSALINMPIQLISKMKEVMAFKLNKDRLKEAEKLANFFEIQFYFLSKQRLYNFLQEEA